FISMSAKKETSKGKACITNQYFTVSSNQMISEVKKIMMTLRKLRRDSSPCKKRSANSTSGWRNRSGTNLLAAHSVRSSDFCGAAARIKKTSIAPKKPRLAMVTSVRRLSLGMGAKGSAMKTKSSMM